MSAQLADNAGTFGAPPQRSEKVRRDSQGSKPTVLADIYKEDANVVVWKRELSASLSESVDRFSVANRSFQALLNVTPRTVRSVVRESLGTTKLSELVEDISYLVEMFCFLFDLKRAGLRLAVLDSAMCPRFHADKVPCRLVCTYHGVATQWLPHRAVDRSQLGSKRGDVSDLEAGLFHSESDIQKFNRGDVALLKGDAWKGNEGAGLVHRSPPLEADAQRLLLTVDFNS